MTLRIQHKNLYLTYLDQNKQISGPSWLLSTLAERLEKYETEYGICCREVAPTTGTLHYHLLIKCKKVISVRNANTLLEMEGIRPHVEKVNNNIRMIIKYIKKNGDFAQLNPENAPKDATMSKKEKAELMLNGNWEELFLNGELGAIDIIRAQKLKTIFDMNRPPKEYKKRLVMWFHGDTGEGKTKTALEIAKQYYDNSYWMSSDSLKWFDGYRGQKVAIIDDFRKGMLSDWSFLLRLLDGYNLLVQIKGGFTTWNPELIIITSPATPEQAFKWTNKEGEEQQWDKQEQLTRRITHEDIAQIYEFPMWEDELKRMEKTIRKFIGLPEEEFLTAEDWSIIEPEGFITPG